MTTSRHVRPNERGAVLVHVAVVLVGLIAFTAFAYDYGVMFVSRREAQNAADAGALAGAISYSYSSPNDQNVARQSAVAGARSNAVWGQTPDIQTTDVTFPACPPGAPGVADTCVRADVFRTNYQRGGGFPLPTFFAQLVGVNEQGVRATATAQLLTGSGTADCIKPVAIPDKWDEYNPAPGGTWYPTSTFDRYDPQTGAVLPSADVYRPAVQGSPGDPGSGFTLPADLGVEVVLKYGNGNDAVDPGWYDPVVLDPNWPNCVGGDCYREAWAGCTGVAVNPGDTLTVEPGGKVGPTNQGVDDLIALDPTATWDPVAKAPSGGCMADGTCTRSPRWIAIPLYDPDQYAYERATISAWGRNVSVHITKILGFWLDQRVGNEIHGHLLYYPTVSLTGNPIPGPSSFARNIILVR